MRIFAIGDIHGEYPKLKSLMSTLESYHNLDLTQDKLVFMGDYIDRGAYSYEVLAFVYKLQRTRPANIVVLAGNHEWLMIDWHEGRDKWDLWGMNGGVAARRSFREKSGMDECPKYLLNWLKSLPLFHEEEGFFFSHAPIGTDEYRGTSNTKYTKDDYIWSFGKNIKEDEHAKHHDNGVVGVCGHVHALRDNIFHPRIYDHYIFTDAGCGCDKNAPLCAVEVISRSVIYAL